MEWHVHLNPIVLTQCSPHKKTKVFDTGKTKEVEKKLEWMLDCQLTHDFIGEKNPIAFYPMNQTTNVGKL